VRISAREIDKDELNKLAMWGIEHSPVADAVQRAVPMDVIIVVN
jgi:hypothetical protein